ITHPRDLAGLPCITLGYGDFQNQLRWEPVAIAGAGRGMGPGSAPGGNASVPDSPPDSPAPAIPAADRTPLELSVHTPITVASSTGIVTLALQHQGVGIAADFAAEAALADGRLVQLLPGWQLGGSYAERTAYALYPPTRHLALKVRALIDHLVGGGG
ncbi:MAG: LysR substrate-binding domain-containing protein, partial [Clostridia bacterium]